MSHPIPGHDYTESTLEGPYEPHRPSKHSSGKSGYVHEKVLKGPKTNIAGHFKKMSDSLRKEVKKDRRAVKAIGKTLLKHQK